MAAQSFNIRSFLGVSILAFALINSPNSFASNSCELVVAPDPSRGAHLVIRPDDADKIFTAARLKFITAMGDGKAFEKTFELLADGKKPKYPEKTLEELKDFRKLGLRLRSEFVVLGEDHGVPQAFEAFMKKLGHLNDALEFNAWKVVPKQAKKVLKTYRVAKIIAALKSFKSASPASIVHEVSDLKIEILALVNQPHSTVLEFHQTRKDLKHLLSLFQAMNDRTPSAEFQNAFDFLAVTNDTLGDMRQGVLEEELTSGESADHDNDIQDLPKDVKDSVKLFLANLKVDLAG